MQTQKWALHRLTCILPLTIDAGAGLESFKASNWFNIPGSLFGIVTGSIAQPIFEHKQLKTNYEVAKTATRAISHTVSSIGIECTNGCIQRIGSG
ncbi:MAG: hypothetical protein WDM71_05940 [Ferruginibacter sp.]